MHNISHFINSSTEFKFFIQVSKFLFTALLLSCSAGTAEADHATHMPKHVTEEVITRCSHDYTADGCASMGEIFEEEGNVNKALNIYRIHCDAKKDANACILAADVLVSRKQVTEALELYRKACMMKTSEEYCDKALEAYRSSGSENSAFKLSKDLCESYTDGSELSRYCYLTGEHYLKKNDQTRAEYYYLKGCNFLNSRDEIHHCIDQAVNLEKMKQFKISAKLYEMNCFKNNIYSFRRGGDVYGKEMNIPTKELNLRKKSCDLQNGDDCYRAYVIYRSIEGDTDNAVKYRRKACELDYREACTGE